MQGKYSVINPEEITSKRTRTTLIIQNCKEMLLNYKEIRMTHSSQIQTETCTKAVLRSY